MKDDETISILNDLIKTCLDGKECFKACMDDASDRHLELTSMLAARQMAWASAASELQEQVRFRGGEPEISGSVAGALHRKWLDFKTAIVGKDDEAVMNECERSETSAEKSYLDALEKDMPGELRPVIERQYQDVTHSHDQLKKLREQLTISA